MNPFPAQDNKVLDTIIQSRQTSRTFLPESPDTALLNAVIEAGRQAPFGELAVFKQTDFRKFFVFPANSSALPKLRGVLMAGLQRVIDNTLTPQLEQHPVLKVPIKAFSNIINSGSSQVGAAPWFVVAAERRGVFPPVEQISLGYVMENMYLKATALGLGMQIISSVHVTGGDDPELCAILGITPGEFGLDACNLGFTDKEPRTEPRAVPISSVTWIK